MSAVAPGNANNVAAPVAAPVAPQPAAVKKSNIAWDVAFKKGFAKATGKEAQKAVAEVIKTVTVVVAQGSQKVAAASKESLPGSTKPCTNPCIEKFVALEITADKVESVGKPCAKALLPAINTAANWSVDKIKGQTSCCSVEKK